MVQISGQVRRPRGRPQVRPDDETRRLMIEAARREFAANGYAGTSMTSVAQRAGVSTRTMYRLVPTKADLFRSVVADRIGRFMLAIDAETLDALPLSEALERILVAYGELTLGEETVWVNRVVIGESRQFPEIAATFYDTAVRRTGEAMANWLRRQSTRGLIRLDDPLLVAGMLRGMMIMDPQRAIMLGQRGVPDSAEIAARAKSCARLFLDGCRLAPR